MGFSVVRDLNKKLDLLSCRDLHPLTGSTVKILRRGSLGRLIRDDLLRCQEIEPVELKTDVGATSAIFCDNDHEDCRSVRKNSCEIPSERQEPPVSAAVRVVVS